MSPSEAKDFFQFVTRTLPNLLSEAREPLEALQKLGDLWKSHRTHNIEDRSDQVAENRSEVDARLTERRKKSRKKSRSSSASESSEESEG